MKDKQNENIRATPDMGIITINKTTGGNPNLYGCSVPNHTKINIEIKHCEDSVGYDGKIFRRPTNSIVSIELSPMQYADLITNLNQGIGTPCTLNRLNDVHIEREVEQENTNDLYNLEIDELIDDKLNLNNKLLEEIQRVSKKKSLSKADKESLLTLALNNAESFKRHSHFVISQINEIIKNKEYEARKSLEASIDAYIEFSKNKSINVQEYQLLKDDILNIFTKEIEEIK